MSLTPTRSQLCETTPILSFAQCPISFWLLPLQIRELQTYEMRVITFYRDSTTAVSSTGRTLVGAKGPENVWLFELSTLLETVKFL